MTIWILAAVTLVNAALLAYEVTLYSSMRRAERGILQACRRLGHRPVGQVVADRLMLELTAATVAECAAVVAVGNGHTATCVLRREHYGDHASTLRQFEVVGFSRSFS